MSVGNDNVVSQMGPRKAVCPGARVGSRQPWISFQLPHKSKLTNKQKTKQRPSNNGIISYGKYNPGSLL
jgi:hypothetical protein